MKILNNRNNVIMVKHQHLRNSGSIKTHLLYETQLRAIEGIVPGFLIASANKGKEVIVSHNEVAKVADHDFSKMSLIPGAVLIHDIQRENNEDLEKEDFYLGAWTMVG